MQLHLNITTPTQAQIVIFPALLSHSDIVLKDMTGTGKTFGLCAAILSKSHPTIMTRNNSNLVNDN
jgi:superfamily II DNA/RNA helicase